MDVAKPSGVGIDALFHHIDEFFLALFFHFGGVWFFATECLDEVYAAFRGDGPPVDPKPQSQATSQTLFGFLECLFPLAVLHLVAMIVGCHLSPDAKNKDELKLAKAQSFSNLTGTSTQLFLEDSASGKTPVALVKHVKTKPLMVSAEEYQTLNASIADYEHAWLRSVCAPIQLPADFAVGSSVSLVGRKTSDNQVILLAYKFRISANGNKQLEDAFRHVVSSCVNVADPLQFGRAKADSYASLGLKRTPGPGSQNQHRRLPSAPALVQAKQRSVTLNVAAPPFYPSSRRTLSMTFTPREINGPSNLSLPPTVSCVLAQSQMYMPEKSSPLAEPVRESKAVPIVVPADKMSAKENGENRGPNKARISEVLAMKKTGAVFKFGRKKRVSLDGRKRLGAVDTNAQ